MTTWAYPCRPADEAVGPLFAACLAIDAMPRDTRIVLVKVGAKWLCAVVDKSQRQAVEGMLLREAVASDLADCPECADPVPPSVSVAQPAAAEPVAAASAERSGRQVQAAAITLHGHRCVVVLVGLDLVHSPGEADMAINDLRPRFGGVDIVLMGQAEDGTPHYHGIDALVDGLSEVPIDRMPWKDYPIG